jgi:hypothetical protein
MSSNNAVKSWFFLILGLLLYVVSIIGGIYIGIWLCFIGGIVDIVNGFNHDPIQAMKMAIGVAKFFFSGVAGWLTFFIGVAFGKGFIDQA